MIALLIFQIQAMFFFSSHLLGFCGYYTSRVTKHAGLTSYIIHITKFFLILFGTKQIT
jgi:hypothetical protein